MKISTIHTGFFKLDGGAMFGVVPRRLWQRLNPPDDNNMCTWAMRSILIETDDRKIIVDTGLGNKQDDKFRSHFEPHGEESLMGSLAKKGLTNKDITDVFLTHLHFDHVGGAVEKDINGNLIPAFPNATYWSNEVHWNAASNPNPREKASFLKENFLPIQEANQLKFIDLEENIEFLPGFNIHFANGHTDSMMLPSLDLAGTKLVYCADLIPSSFHIGLPYVMSYDIRPLDTMKEKEALLENAVNENWLLFFEHDPVTACATVKRNERGRIVLDELVQIDEIGV